MSASNMISLQRGVEDRTSSRLLTYERANRWAEFTWLSSQSFTAELLQLGTPWNMRVKVKRKTEQIREGWIKEMWDV